uniref:Reverse transcriptase domain-containing protein n=1 Tax=Strongyloides papillosus TaxID=174720 RepID=A0A0N5BDV2_STREA
MTTKWTNDDIERLVYRVNELGSKKETWEILTKEFPGRTALALKSKYGKERNFVKEVKLTPTTSISNSKENGKENDDNGKTIMQTRTDVTQYNDGNAANDEQNCLDETMKMLNIKFNKLFDSVCKNKGPKKLVKFRVNMNHPKIKLIDQILMNWIERYKDFNTAKSRKTIKKLILTAGLVLRSEITGSCTPKKRISKSELNLKKKIKKLRIKIEAINEEKERRKCKANGSAPPKPKHNPKLLYREMNKKKVKLDHLHCQTEEMIKHLENEYEQKRIGNEKLNVLKTEGESYDGKEEELLMEDAIQFYHELYSEGQPPSKTPILDEYEQHVKKNYRNIPEMLSKDRIREIVALKVKYSANFKAAGVDLIPTFCYKYFKSALNYLQDWIYGILNKEIRIMKSDCAGRTILLFKSGCRKQPQNYRPITMMPTDYKILTGTIAEILSEQIGPDFISREQLAIRRNVNGTLEGLAIDKCIIASTTFRASERKTGTQLCTSWIDFSKAFDSIYRSSLHRIVDMLPISSYIKELLKEITKKWQSQLVLNNRNSGNEVNENMFQIKRGILQGDSLSPILFVLVLNAASFKLNQQNKIKLRQKLKKNLEMNHQSFMDDIKLYSDDVSTMDKLKQILHSYGLFVLVLNAASFKLNQQNKIKLRQKLKKNLEMNHQSFMDDIKLYSDDVSTMDKLKQILHSYGHEVGLQMNQKKCSDLVIDAKNPKAETEIESQLPFPVNKDGYKYLGLTQTTFDLNKICMASLQEKILPNVSKIFSSKLSVRQMKNLFNSTIVPASNYIATNIQSKQKINGLLNDLEKLDTKIRSIMEKNNVKFYSTSTARLYIDESDGGYGMKSLRSEAAISYINKSLYIVFNERLEPLLELYQIMTSKGNQNPLNNASKLAEIFKFKLNFSKPNEVTINGIQINSLKEARTKVKEIIRKHENDKWLQDWGKSMKYAKTFIELKDRIELPYMKTNVSAMTFRNTYGAAEEQLFTNTHVQADRKYVGKCRKCKVAQETCYHILSCCDAWVGTLYVERHNRIARLIYEELCRKYKLKVPKVNEKIP